LRRDADKDLSIGLRITGSVKIRPKLLDPIRSSLDVIRACSKPSMRVQFVGRNEEHRRQLLEVVPRVPLPGAIFEESRALGRVRRSPVVDDGREFPEQLIEHPGLLGECGASA
jgi:hypothetical protein